MFNDLNYSFPPVSHFTTFTREPSNNWYVLQSNSAIVALFIKEAFSFLNLKIFISINFTFQLLVLPTPFIPNVITINDKIN